MTEIVQHPLMNLSDALAERARLARPLIAAIAAGGHRIRTGTLWRKDVVVASEQRFPDLAEVEVKLADGAGFAARVAGRDPGTNIIAFKLDGTPDPTLAGAAEPQPGALALAVGAADEGVVGLEEALLAGEDAFCWVGVLGPELVEGVFELVVDGELADVVQEAGGEGEAWSGVSPRFYPEQFELLYPGSTTFCH